MSVDRKVTEENTLVKYEKPILVTSRNDNIMTAEQRAKIVKRRLKSINCQGGPRIVVGKDTGGGGLTKKETEAILQLLIPPIEWVEGENIWRQTVCTIPSEPHEVIELENMLDTRLKQRRARENGICPVRRELMVQCLDELIRQETIHCADRGLLLFQIRNEYLKTLDAYQAAYESSVSYKVKKSLQTEVSDREMDKEILDITNELEQIEKDIADMEEQVESEEKRFAQQMAHDEKKRSDDLETQWKIMAQLKNQLMNIVAPRKQQHAEGE